jgi:diphthine-ammonia ligase
MYESKNCFVSWSGGKDCCLALYKAINQGFNPQVLLTMFSMENGTSSAHRIEEDIIKAQADAIGIQHLIGRASFYEYEKVFLSKLLDLKSKGIDVGIFGDIDLQEHKDWEDNVCSKASMTAFLPLWRMDRRDVLIEFLEAGFKAKIILVNSKMMDTRYLGRDLSRELMKELKRDNVDVCGENGEYHTVVYDGPIFKKPLNIKCGVEIIPVADQWAKINIEL